MSFGVKLRIKEIKMTTYVRRGALLIRRDALDWDDPDLPYNWIRKTFGLDPEEFGYSMPQAMKDSYMRNRW